jgi:hypothetical protein
MRGLHLYRGREVVVDDQDQLAAGVPGLHLAVRGRRILPVVPASDLDGQRAVVEPRRQPD